MLGVTVDVFLCTYQILNIAVISAAFVDGRATVVLGCEDNGWNGHEGGGDQHIVHPHHGLDVEEEHAEKEKPNQVHARRQHRSD